MRCRTSSSTVRASVRLPWFGPTTPRAGTRTWRAAGSSARTRSSRRRSTRTCTATSRPSAPSRASAHSSPWSAAGGPHAEGSGGGPRHSACKVGRELDYQCERLGSGAGREVGSGRLGAGGCFLGKGHQRGHKGVCSSKITPTSQNGPHFSLLGHFCG